MADKSLPGKGIGRDWFTFAEFNLMDRPDSEPLVSLSQALVGERVRNLNISPALLEQLNLALSKALMNITEKAGGLRSGYPVTIRVLISEPVPAILEADIILDQDAGIERAARAAPRGWGFFLVEGYTGGNPESGEAAIPFIDLFLYLEGESGS